MKTLLVDNHDSFTYNLFQLLAEVNGEEPTVVRNDEAGWEDLSRLRFDNVVLSPGPGRPERARDFGVCAEAIRAASVPLLGVCLGHQGLGWLHGGEVVHAPQPMHGRFSTIHHDGSALLAGLPRRFQAVRYHSLCLAQPLPASLARIAWTGDGVVMGVAHRELPQWGVQFHPESIGSEHGRRLLANFRDLTAAAAGGIRPGSPATIRPRRPPEPHQPDETPRPDAPPRSEEAPRPREAPRPAKSLRLRVERLDLLPDPEQAFRHLYADCEHSFWLDSSRVGERARFSFMGAPGPLGATVSYDVAAAEVRVDRGGERDVHRESIFDYLDAETSRRCPDSPPLPFDFDCGLVGYIGYEAKADCGGDRRHRSPLPDAAFLFADRVIAFDHLDRCTYLLCLGGPGSDEAASRWLGHTAARLRALALAAPGEDGEREQAPNVDGLAGEPLAAWRLARPRQRHLEDIAVCQRRLADGESYEVCLTNALETDCEQEPLALYRRLRRINPAPFAAYLRFGGISILSSSPERFLAVDGARGVEARPIKGTSRRGETAAEDAALAEALRSGEKDRAENLMITDLLRNDLGAVCEIGSVEVPQLMAVETYETVHQLVSSVRGRLRGNLGAADCVRACFPPGSMTGAPKRRTMEILDRLEAGPRGVYSGAIGYFGLGGGCDLSVVIRTIVLTEGVARIGIGGAIVTQSEPQAELEEALLKGLAPARAVDPSLAVDGRLLAGSCKTPVRSG
jgi:para-aminobenzoate synthetase